MEEEEERGGSEGGGKGKGSGLCEGYTLRKRNQESK